MSIIDYLKKIFSTGGAVQKRYHGNKVVFSFPKENISIEVDSVSAPNGSKGVLYDCFLVALGQWHKQGMGEDDFIKDMTKVINLVTSGHSDEEVIGTLLSEHISSFGRLIDTDLCTCVSELQMVLSALNRNSNRNDLLTRMMQYAQKRFGDKLFITKYKNTGLGLQPYLVSYKEFIKNR